MSTAFQMLQPTSDSELDLRSAEKSMSTTYIIYDEVCEFKA